MHVDFFELDFHERPLEAFVPGLVITRRLSEVQSAQLWPCRMQQRGCGPGGASSGGRHARGRGRRGRGRRGRGRGSADAAPPPAAVEDGDPTAEAECFSNESAAEDAEANARAEENDEMPKDVSDELLEISDICSNACECFCVCLGNEFIYLKILLQLPTHTTTTTTITPTKTPTTNTAHALHADHQSLVDHDPQQNPPHQTRSPTTTSNANYALQEMLESRADRDSDDVVGAGSAKLGAGVDEEDRHEPDVLEPLCEAFSGPSHEGPTWVAGPSTEAPQPSSGGAASSWEAPAAPLEPPPAGSSLVEELSDDRVITWKVPHGHGGSITWYKSKFSFVAQCCNDGHSSRCRATRSSRDSAQRGLKLPPSHGRPLGTLVAWIMFGHQELDQAKHLEFIPSRAQRSAGRALLKECALGRRLLSKERKKDDGEDSEHELPCTK